MTTEAFIETTVLTDLLLKKDGSEGRAQRKIASFTVCSIPQYAWKEFKNGPLARFVWAHNKLVETNSYQKLLQALQRVSITPQRYLTSTAIQAIHTASASFLSINVAQFQSTYGAKASLDSVFADMIRLELKRLIQSAWSSRSSLMGGAQQTLTCYPDHPIKITTKGSIDLTPRDCPSNSACCLKGRLAKRDRDLRAVYRAMAPYAAKTEIQRRRKALHEIERQSAHMTPQQCRHFGDAYFVLFCPPGATVLTTNVRDIEPMALALNISFDTP